MLAKQQQDDQAIGAWRQVIQRFSDDLICLAGGCGNGTTQYGGRAWSQRQAGQAIEAYQELIDRFGDSSDPALRKRTAKALMKTEGLMLAEQEQLDKALHSVEEAVDKLRGAGRGRPGHYRGRPGVSAKALTKLERAGRGGSGGPRRRASEP